MRGKARVLVMTAVTTEREAILHGLPSDDKFDVRLAGVGPVSAAVKTARALAAAKYDLVISAGIGGGFAGRAEPGSVVLANEIVAVDLGVETAAGFCSLAEMGLGDNRLQLDTSLVNAAAKALLTAKLPLITGPVLTVTTAAGTAETTAERVLRVPGAVAEAMEGYGVALAAADAGLAVLELRAISNLVGPRNRSAWRITEALELLTAAISALAEGYK